MAPNRFASILHRNTNRLTLILIYVLLDWILIAMILLNSLFSYLIAKYADYFGLKRPCVLCSRIDHGRDKRVRKDMICGEHAVEISELGFCPSHQKLVKCQSMCRNCFSSSFYNIEKDSRCCCSDGKLEDETMSPVLVENGDSHLFDFAGVEDVELVVAEENAEAEEQSRELDVAEESQVADISKEAETHESDSEFFENMEIEEYEEVKETENDVSGKGQEQRSNGIEDESDSEFFVNLEIEEQETVNVLENELPEEAHVLTGDETLDEFEAPRFGLKLEIDEQEEIKEEAFATGIIEQVQNQTYSAMEDDEDQTKGDRGCNIEQPSTLETNDEVESQVVSIKQSIVIDQIGSVVENVVHLVQEELLSAEDVTLVGSNDSLLPTESHKSGLSASNEDPSKQNGFEYELTVEMLKAELEASTRAFNEVYTELEQERNDAAEASAQTMAMITRLQEEKAALQLEASQYQRMMDEQIEFDQEAVLLLDEIVRRRERENQELDKELELYRKRFAELRRSTEDQNMGVASESVSVCCSSFGDQDSDELSTEDDDHHHHQSVTMLDDDPFVSVENERLAILNQLNELEMKLVQLNEEESPHFDQEEGRMKCRIEEEVGHVYERLQGLEEDNEFLRNCMKSVKKGDEGMRLVQEILQHLKALRHMEES
ncbi:hypothetical protein QQ045_017206 [Rhodiola kirilowii]